jgi:GMP synthase (glutamine-hydrolysing)
MLSKPGLILQHEHEGPPARFADWLHDRGVVYELHAVWEQPSLPDPREFEFVVSLGSERSAGETSGWVPAEVAMLREAIAADVPVFGMCFGGQALAVALGGRVDVLEVPEIGWIAVESVDPAIPDGPWVHHHHDRIELPAGAGLVARTSVGPAAFWQGRHLGLQFHPEADAELLDAWVRSDARLAETGLTPRDVAEQGAEFSAPARELAYRLFDGWLERLTATP